MSEDAYWGALTPPPPAWLDREGATHPKDSLYPSSRPPQTYNTEGSGSASYLVLSAHIMTYEIFMDIQYNCLNEDMIIHLKNAINNHWERIGDINKKRTSGLPGLIFRARWNTAPWIKHTVTVPVCPQMPNREEKYKRRIEIYTKSICTTHMISHRTSQTGRSSIAQY